MVITNITNMTSLSSGSSIPARPPKRPTRIQKPRTAEMPVSSSLTALPTKPAGNAGQRLAARRASSGTTGFPKALYIPNLSVNITPSTSPVASLSPSPSTPPASPSTFQTVSRIPSLSRKSAVRKRSGSIFQDVQASSRPSFSSKLPGKIQSDYGLDSEAPSIPAISRHDSQVSVTSSAAAPVSPSSDTETSFRDTDFDLNSDGDVSSKCTSITEDEASYKVNFQPSESSFALTIPPFDQSSNLPSLHRQDLLPELDSELAESSMVVSSVSTVGTLTYSDPIVRQDSKEAAGLFDSVRGLMADIGHAIGPSSESSNCPTPDLSKFDHSTFLYPSLVAAKEKEARNDSHPLRFRSFKYFPADSITSATSQPEQLPLELDSSIDQKPLTKHQDTQATTSSNILSENVTSALDAPAALSTPALTVTEFHGQAAQETINSSSTSSTTNSTSPDQPQDQQKRGIWGLLRSASAKPSPSSDSRKSSLGSPIPNTNASSLDGVVSQHKTVLQAIPAPNPKLSMSAQPTFQLLSSRLNTFAAGLKAPKPKSSLETDENKQADLRVRLPRREVDENKLAELVISCADARHVLKTDTSVTKLKEVGLRLEEGWREQLSEAQKLRTRLELTQDTLEDLEDENRHLRSQLGTLSEQIALREDDIKFLQKASADQIARERGLREQEAKELETNNLLQVAKIRRVLAEERTISAQLQLLLASASAASDTTIIRHSTLSFPSLCEPGSMFTLPATHLHDARRRQETSSTSADSRAFTDPVSFPSLSSMPSLEVHDASDMLVHTDHSESKRHFGSLPRSFSSQSRLSPRIGDEVAEYDVLFNLPHSPNTSRPPTTLFSESQSLGQLHDMAYAQQKMIGHEAKANTVTALAKGVLSCPSHRANMAFATQMEKNRALHKKIILVVSNDSELEESITAVLTEHGASSVIHVRALSTWPRETTPEKGHSESGFKNKNAPRRLTIDLCDPDGIDKTLADCIKHYGAVDCILNAINPQLVQAASMQPDQRVIETVVWGQHRLVCSEIQLLNSLAEDKNHNVEIICDDDEDALAELGFNNFSIVNIAYDSVDGHGSIMEMCKLAVIGLGKAKAIELESSDVRLNTIIYESLKEDTTPSNALLDSICYLLSKSSCLIRGSVACLGCDSHLSSTQHMVRCSGPPLCASIHFADPSSTAHSATPSLSSLFRDYTLSRLDAMKQVADHQLYLATCEENTRLQSKTLKQEKEIEKLAQQLKQLEQRLEKTEEAVSPLFS